MTKRSKRVAGAQQVKRSAVLQVISIGNGMIPVNSQNIWDQTIPGDTYWTDLYK